MDGAEAAGRRLTDALRAHADGGVLVPTPIPAEPAPWRESARPLAPATSGTTARRQVVIALLVALVAGVLFGAGLAWVSVTMPGLLAALG